MAKTDNHTQKILAPVDRFSPEIEAREKSILHRIQKHYQKKEGREIEIEEAKEIANNLLHFAKAIYGV